VSSKCPYAADWYLFVIFIAREHCNAGAWGFRSVRLSVYHVPRSVSKRLNILSQLFFSNHSSFSNTKHLCQIPTASSPTGASNAGEVWKIGTFSLCLGKCTTIGPQLLWNANRNSYAIYRTVPFPVTLSDIWRSTHFSTVVTLYAQLTRDLLAIAKSFVTYFH